jgi:hypothetical protein
MRFSDIVPFSVVINFEILRSRRDAAALALGKLANLICSNGTPLRELGAEHQEQVPLDHGQIEIPASGAQGVIIAQGGNIGGAFTQKTVS